MRRPRRLMGRRTSRSVLISLQVELILQRAGDMSGGYELQRTDAKGEGVFATRSFQVGETVMVGVIEAELDHNHAHASQLSEKRFVLHGGLIAKVKHSCEPNCGIHSTPAALTTSPPANPSPQARRSPSTTPCATTRSSTSPPTASAARHAAVTASPAGRISPPSAKRATEASSPPTSPTSTTRTPPNGPGHLVRIEPGSPYQTGQILNVAGVVTE